MELKFVNSDGDSITIGKDRPYILESRGNLSGLDGNVITQKSPGQKGESYVRTSIKGRDITLAILVIADTADKLEIAKQNLLKVFNPEMEVCQLYYKDDYKERYINVVVEDGVKMSDKSKTNLSQRAFIDLYAPDPYWYEKEENIELAAVVGGLEFPLELSDEFEFERDGKELEVNNVGTTEAGVVIDFHGPAQNPKVINLTTGEYIQVDTTLTKGQVLTINTNDDSIKIELDGVDAFNLINIKSTLWKLRRGINILSYEAGEVPGADTANVKIKYKTKWNGV